MSEHALSLRSEAESLPFEERKRILAEIPETELHGYLASLFRRMKPSDLVEVTHGVDELGKDLVILRDDPLSPDVIAIVVKRGSVRAKTAGDVDDISAAVTDILDAKGTRITAEIRSQVRQAQVHPAELRSVFAKLRVTKVIVVLVGDISTRVRGRFEGEVGATADVKDVNWLVSAFTEYYPQVFFDARVTDFLDQRIQCLEQDSFYAKSGKTLSECFVEPIIRPDRKVSVNEKDLSVRVRADKIPFARLQATLDRRRRVLLVGDAGSGKSKAAAKLCINAYRDHLASSKSRRGDSDDGPVAIPLLISARELEGESSHEELLNHLLPVAVRDRFRLGTLVVDALDEVVAANRAAVLKRAIDFADEFGTSLLVTARNTAAFGTAPDGFFRCELLPFQVGQALKLVDKVLTAPDVLPALKSGIKRIRDQLPMSPLSLLLLIQVVADRKEVPASITELYERFLDLVFGRWDKDKGVDVLFEYVVKKRFLAALAYHEFFLKGRLEVPQADFERFVTAYATEYGWDDSRLRDFVKEVERAGILAVQEDCFFRHRSFLDYFVALYFYERRSDFENLTDGLVRTYFDPVWSDVTFFFAGLAREVSPELINGVFSFPDTRPIEKLMAGRLLQAGWHSTTKIKEHALRGALGFAPDASDYALELIASASKNSHPAPRIFGDLFAIVTADHAFGSTFLAQELSAMADELEGVKLTGHADALRRLAVLWTLGKTAEPKEVEKRLKKYVADVQGAALGAAGETEFLLLAGSVDAQSEDLKKAVGRRLRRILQQDPTLLKAIAPDAKLPYRPPGKRS